MTRRSMVRGPDRSADPPGALPLHSEMWYNTDARTLCRNRMSARVV